MKRIISILFSAILFVFNCLPVSAQTETGQEGAGIGGMPAEDQKMIAPDYIIPPGRGGVMPFSGQNHFYSLVYRGNGESVVTLRIALTNTSEKDKLSEVTLRIPKIVDPKDLSAYQIITQGYCIRYEPLNYPVTGNYQPKCLEYSEPDYYNYYGGGKYQKAKTDFSGDTLKVTLPTAIVPNKTGSFFVYFRGFGYAKKNLLGAYTFEFESLKTEDQINELTIGISTDADQFLKGAKGQVEYRTQEASMALKAAPDAGAGAVANPTIDNFVQRIGQGSVVRKASNLAALESYKVKGMYADSRAKLYGRELLTVFSVVVVLAAMVIFVLRFLQNKRKKAKEKENSSLTSDESLKNFGFSAGVGFASSLIAAGYTIAVYAIANSLNDLVDYQYQAVIMILLVVVSFAIYILILIGPSIFVGMKKGMGWGLGTFVMTIVWLVLFAIVTIGVLFIFKTGYNYPTYPVMRSGMEIQKDVAM